MQGNELRSPDTQDQYLELANDTQDQYLELADENLSRWEYSMMRSSFAFQIVTYSVYYHITNISPLSKIADIVIRRFLYSRIEYGL